jgi:hypothetical protein
VPDVIILSEVCKCASLPPGRALPYTPRAGTATSATRWWASYGDCEIDRGRWAEHGTSTAGNVGSASRERFPRGRPYSSENSGNEGCAGFITKRRFYLVTFVSPPPVELVILVMDAVQSKFAREFFPLGKWHSKIKSEVKNAP